MGLLIEVGERERRKSLRETAQILSAVDEV